MKELMSWMMDYGPLAVFAAAAVGGAVAVVLTQNVVRMGMRVNQRVQMRDPGPQNLRPEVRRRVDDDIPVPVLHQNRRTQTVVPRV